MSTEEITFRKNCIDSLESESEEYKKTVGDLKNKKVKKVDKKKISELDRARYVRNFFTCVALILFITTIIFIGLSQARIVQPLIALYIFCGSLASFIAIYAVHRYMKYVAGDDLEIYQKYREPLPERKKQK